MKLDEVKLTLENERAFYDAYLACKNKQGSSIGPQRRSLINNFAQEVCGHSLNMMQQLELEMYFNERYELCPYGLRSQAEIGTRETVKQIKEVINEVDALVKPKEVKNMKAIETKVFVYGTDAATLSDDDLFGRIAGIEAEIRNLEAIENKPEKLKAKIDSMKADIAGLVKLVDERK